MVYWLSYGTMFKMSIYSNMETCRRHDMFFMIFMADTKGKISSEISASEMVFPSYIIFNDMKKKLLNIDLAPAVRPLYSYFAAIRIPLPPTMSGSTRLMIRNAARKESTQLSLALISRAATVAKVGRGEGRTEFSSTSMRTFAGCCYLLH